MSEESRPKGGAKKLDTGKPKLALVHPAFWGMVAKGEESSFLRTLRGLILGAAHADTMTAFTGYIREAVWALSDNLGAHETLVLASEAMAYGERLYGRNNWKKGLNYSRLLDATLRHLQAIGAGELKAKDSGVPHIAHVAANLHMLVGLMSIGTGVNDLIQETD